MESHDTADRSLALQKIGPPAIAIAVVAGIDALMCVAGLLLNLLQIAGTPLIDVRGDERAFWFLSGVWGALMSVFGIGVSGFVL